MVGLHLVEGPAHGDRRYLRAGGADGGPDAADPTNCLSVVYGYTPVAHAGELGVDTSEIQWDGTNAARGLDRKDPVQLVRRQVREHRLAYARAHGRLPPADPRRHVDGKPPAELFEIDDITTVEHGQMHNEPGRPVQFVQ